MSISSTLCFFHVKKGKCNNNQCKFSHRVVKKKRFKKVKASNPQQFHLNQDQLTPPFISPYLQLHSHSRVVPCFTNMPYLAPTSILDAFNTNNIRAPIPKETKTSFNDESIQNVRKESTSHPSTSLYIDCFSELLTRCLTEWLKMLTLDLWNQTSTQSTSTSEFKLRWTIDPYVDSTMPPFTTLYTVVENPLQSSTILYGKQSITKLEKIRFLMNNRVLLRLVDPINVSQMKQDKKVQALSEMKFKKRCAIYVNKGIKGLSKDSIGLQQFAYVSQLQTSGNPNDWSLQLMVHLILQIQINEMNKTDETNETNEKSESKNISSSSCFSFLDINYITSTTTRLLSLYKNTIYTTKTLTWLDLCQIMYDLNTVATQIDIHLTNSTTTISNKWNNKMNAKKEPYCEKLLNYVLDHALLHRNSCSIRKRQKILQNQKRRITKELIKQKKLIEKKNKDREEKKDKEEEKEREEKKEKKKQKEKKKKNNVDLSEIANLVPPSPSPIFIPDITNDPFLDWSCNGWDKINVWMHHFALPYYDDDSSLNSNTGFNDISNTVNNIEGWNLYLLFQKMKIECVDDLLRLDWKQINAVCRTLSLQHVINFKISLGLLDIQVIPGKPQKKKSIILQINRNYKTSVCRHYHYNHVEINEKDYAVACKHGVKCHYVHNEFKIELDSMRISHGQPPLAVLETSFDSKKLQLSKAVFRQNLNSRRPGTVGKEISYDGSMFARGTVNKVSVYDTIKWCLLGHFEGHTDRVTCVCFAPNNFSLVSASLDKTIRIWNLNTASLSAILRDTSTVPSMSINSQRFDNGDGVIGGISVTLDGLRILSRHYNGDVSNTNIGVVKKWEVKSKKCIAINPGKLLNADIGRVYAEIGMVKHDANRLKVGVGMVEHDTDRLEVGVVMKVEVEKVKKKENEALVSFNKKLLFTANEVNEHLKDIKEYGDLLLKNYEEERIKKMNVVRKGWKEQLMGRSVR